ncbi:transcriptional regulator [Bacillus sp. FJAT-18017]|uniref:response regulator transcription factor n=1 Tax=Bacillus sp. FJAT-18017 TaxID=1705566 RepID=UPI0006AFDC18|nr:response regulator transcription factor [Bacillus sp. FJAT-18017]ALC92161.1 transcriptional regulator [Bacillus sp. FJAT-18017]
MKHILIIEDDQDIAELQRDYLEAEGFRVDIEENGKAGLDKALSEEFDCFILDLMLPGLGGFEICRHIRQVKDTPIVMISARKEDVDKIRGLGLGADDYMVKPFSPGEMVARVKAHLSRYDRLLGRETARKSVISLGALAIDIDDHRVYREGQEITLTAKEYDLLVFFVKNPNRVFSKEQLFEHIWGIDAFGDISTVTVHIRKLREKIEMDSSKPQYIETVWGAGYRLKI